MLAGTCKKESPTCHHNIVIKNGSIDPVIYALKFTTGINSVKCLLEGPILKPNEQINSDLNYCWEDELSTGKTFEFYILDPKKYNQPGVFYSCDSIEIKNKVLKHYVLTLEDLMRSDFTVTYQ